MTTEATRTFLGEPVGDNVLCGGFDQPAPSERFPVGHPVADAVTSINAELDRVVEAAMWTLQPGELGTLLVATTRTKARVEELELRIACAAERADVGSADASTSTGVWWAEHTNQVKPEAIKALKLAKALDYDHEPVRDALAAGDLVVAQAEVIVGAVQQLRKGPARDLVDAETVALAEKTLIELGREHDAKALRLLGRRILDIVAPEVGEALEAKLLAKEEREAIANARFTLREDGQGRAYGRFTLPATYAQMFRKQLMSLASPAGKTPTQVDQDNDSDREPLFGPARMGAALMAYIERYPTDRLPTTGGIAADVVVNVDLDTMITGLGSAVLDTGAVISPAMARMMACDAGIIPLVMNGTSVVLDCGRKNRFHTKAQRIVIAVQQGTCTALGCDFPPGLCHVHHEIPWAQSGGTNTKDARLLCPKHHHRAHDPAYTMSKLPGGKVAFARRT